MAGRKYPFVTVALGVAAFAAWMSNAFLVTSWAGHRALSPNWETGEVIPYNNHGIMYVTQRDLDSSHLLLAAAAALVVAAFVSNWIGNRDRK